MTPADFRVMQNLVDSIRVDKPDNHLYQLSTPRFEVEVIIVRLNAAKGLGSLNWQRHYRSGWPYEDDKTVNSSAVDIIAG